MRALAACIVLLLARVSNGASEGDAVAALLPLPTLSVRLQPISVASYTLRIVVGSPGSPSLPVIVDTGSSDLVLLAPPGGEYDPENSTSARSLGDPGVRYDHVLQVDGERQAFESCSVLSDTVALEGRDKTTTVSLLYAARLVSAPSPSPLPQNYPWSAGPELHNWTDASGLLGMAFPNLSRINSSWSSLLAAGAAGQPSVFALDFQPPGGAASSYLHLHGVPESYAGRLLWSEAQPEPDESLTHHILPLYGLSVCGVGLFANFSSNWFAIVDSGATCLSLPGEFFDSLMEWVPHECVWPGTEYATCFVPLGVDAAALPDLSFRLSERGPALTLPLSELLIEHSGGRLSYCVRRLGDVLTNPTHLHISFGSMVLRSLFVAFDVDSRRLGMVSKRPPQNNNSLCADVAVCDSGQTLYRPMNVCEEPPCGDYFFKEIDFASHTCRFTNGFVAMAILPLIGCVGADFALHRNFKRQSALLRRRVQG